MSETILLPQEYVQLLQDLSRESRETPDELMIRLLQKEHFDRHFYYDALRGKTTPKTCMSIDCFMKGKGN